MKHTIEIEYDDWGGVRRIEHVDICYSMSHGMVESYEHIPNGSPRMTIWRELERSDAGERPETHSRLDSLGK